jgi:hypothetical protein
MRERRYQRDILHLICLSVVYIMADNKTNCKFYMYMFHIHTGTLSRSFVPQNCVSIADATEIALQLPAPIVYIATCLPAVT